MFEDAESEHDLEDEGFTRHESFVYDADMKSDDPIMARHRSKIDSKMGRPLQDFNDKMTQLLATMRNSS
jgi:hypothetical protein